MELDIIGSSPVVRSAISFSSTTSYCSGLRKQSCFTEMSTMYNLTKSYFQHQVVTCSAESEYTHPILNH